jgi:hypothetical protein
MNRKGFKSKDKAIFPVLDHDLGSKSLTLDKLIQ